MTGIGGLVLFSGILFWLFAGLGSGALGSYGARQFSTHQDTLEKAINVLYEKFPEYNIPSKWQKFNNWDTTSYSNRNSHIFYFNSNPEEMIYVTYIANSDPTISILAVRAVNTGKEEWEKAHHTFTSRIQTRINNRFQSEIISKLDKITGLNSKNWKN